MQIEVRVFDVRKQIDEIGRDSYPSYRADAGMIVAGNMLTLTRQGSEAKNLLMVLDSGFKLVIPSGIISQAIAELQIEGKRETQFAVSPPAEVRVIDTRLSKSDARLTKPVVLGSVVSLSSEKHVDHSRSEPSGDYVFEINLDTGYLVCIYFRKKWLNGIQEEMEESDER